MKGLDEVRSLVPSAEDVIAVAATFMMSNEAAAELLIRAREHAVLRTIAGALIRIADRIDLNSSNDSFDVCVREPRT